MDNLIEVENLVKYFPVRTGLFKRVSAWVKAVDGVTFDIKKGETLGLVGETGCGKTTTINIICNLIKYDGGEVFYKSCKVTPDFVSYKNNLGMVLSQPYYVDIFNVIEYWKFVCQFQNVPNSEIENRIKDLISLFDLKKDQEKQIKELSSGSQMKVTLGAAIIHNPELLVLDEPFINIDIETTEKIMNILKGFKGKKTIFITSHNLDLVIELCDNFLIMDKGKIVQNINKTDFKNTITLKEKVKKLLVKEYKEINLSWLG